MVVDDGAEQSSHISVICSSYMRDMFKCQVRNPTLAAHQG